MDQLAPANKSPNLEAKRLGIWHALGLGTRECRAWSWYSWANHGFITTVMTAMLPIYFHDVAAATLPEPERLAIWGYLTGAGLAASALISPLLGAMADAMGAQKRFLAFFMGLGSLAAVGLWQVQRGDWQLAAALAFVGNLGFVCGNVYHDAMLPALVARFCQGLGTLGGKPSQVTLATVDNEAFAHRYNAELRRVSLAGYAAGYLGGGLLLGLNLWWTLNPSLFGFADKGSAVRASFVSVGVWWLGFSWPLFRRLPETAVTGQVVGARAAFAAAVSRLAVTGRQLGKLRQLGLFLAAFWLYSDGIGTIIKMSAIYGRGVGIGTTHLVGALLLTQFLGVPATFVYGRFAARIGTRPAIQCGLLVYVGVCVLGYFMTSPWHFWVLAFLVALVQGGTQALSRSLYATMIPRARAAEFFSFMSVSSRFAGILGPLFFGAMLQFTGESRLSILLLGGFFVAGMALLSRVDVASAQRLRVTLDEEGAAKAVT